MQAGHQYLDGLLWESVNDAGARGELTASLGLCGRHSRELLTFPGERLGVAIIQRVVLVEALQRLDAPPVPKRPSWIVRLRECWRHLRRSAARNEDSGPPILCPACTQQARAESWALTELVEHLPGDLDAPLLAAGGLCWTHLQTALNLPGQKDGRRRLVDIHRRLWGDLVGLLDAFIRKYDYRFRHEPSVDGEQASIERALDILTGEYPNR